MMNEQRIHQVFEISVILKGLDALVECAGGLLLFVTPTQWLVRWTELLTHDELTEDRHDLVAQLPPCIHPERGCSTTRTGLLPARML